MDNSTDEGIDDSFSALLNGVTISFYTENNVIGS
jgi:hypothetical protein